MRFLPLLFALVLLPLTASAQVWELVWSDEFETDGLPDAARWGYDVGGSGWGNNELQFYTENREENARVEDGVLVIEARNEPMGGRQYTSARLVTRNKGDWTYGRIEVRAKLPAGRGTWPAIWMLSTEYRYGNGGWPANGEIDIMEHVGFDLGRVHGTVHTEAYNHSIGTSRGASKTVSQVDQEFHVYSIDWSPSQIDFYIDGGVYFRYFNDDSGWTAWPFDQPFHLLLNIAIGGDWGGQQGVDDTIFPVQMEVDYVRVYENTALPEVSFAAPATAAAGDTIELTADATISQGNIAEVTFLQGDGVLGTDTEAPYTWSVADAQPGCYQITVRATDALGWSTTTDATDLTVGSDCPQAPYLIAAHAIPGTVEAEYFDLGGNGTGYLDLDNENQGGAIRTDEGVDIETTADVGGGHNVGWIANREWLQYTVDVKTAGAYTVGVRAASESDGGTLKIEFDGEDKTGDISFGSTGGWQTWETITMEGVELEAGLQVMRLRFSDAGYNLNYVTFTLETGTATEADGLPEGFALDQNYPNPFNPTTRIAYTLPVSGPVTLTVFDVYGRRVATPLDGVRPAGQHHVDFAAGDLPSGLYFYRLATPLGQTTRVMTLLK